MPDLGGPAQSNPVVNNPGFDLDSMLGGPTTQPAQAQPAATGAIDPLADIFGTGPVSQPAQA